MPRHKKPIGLALLVLFGGPVIALARLLLELPPLPARLRARWQWALRKAFWSHFARLKFRGSQEQDFPIPSGSPRKIQPVPFTTKFPGISIQNIMVADRIPRDELRRLHDWLMRIFTWFQVTIMYRILSPMQPGLEPIAADPYEALRRAYPKRHRALFAPPMMPLELQGSPDLSALAVKGPYAGYLKKYSWGQDPQADKEWDIPKFIEQAKWDAAKLGRCEDNLYEWDFRDLKNYECQDGLYDLGCQVLFVASRTSKTVRPIRIKSVLGISQPGDDTWEFAKRLALCAATNHLSLVCHFNGIHLASGAHLAIATRNRLFPDHVLCRLLWPYIYHTQLSNRVVTRAQMVEGGDFDSIFSFTHKGMCDLFSATYRQFQFSVNDPEDDARRRGILNGGFDIPTQNDLVELFEVFYRQAERYLEIYYNKNDAVLQKDEPVLKWLDDLNHHDGGVPNGVPVTRGNVTLANLSRLLASFMYLVTVRHDLAGSFLWNYQLWAHQQPPRLYRNGQRLPLDVYQRLVNANFNLNVPRTRLMRKPDDDFSYLASPQCGQQAEAKRVWREFQAELAQLEDKWRGQEPWCVWRSIRPCWKSTSTSERRDEMAHTASHVTCRQGGASQ